MVEKRGQQMMGMSFGMIFAIFMIVVFVVIAFIAVRNFLDIGKTIDVGFFYEDLQDTIDDAWRSQSSDSTFRGNLPSGVRKICFGDLNGVITASEDYLEIRDFEIYEANTFLIPPSAAEGLGFKMIDHLDIDEITKVRNPYCVDVSSGFRIKKGFNDKLVVIE